jgi:hypothetical protein
MKRIEKSLTRIMKRTLAKARLPQSFINCCYVWDSCAKPSWNGLRAGNFLFCPPLSHRAKERLTQVLPELIRNLHRTSVACGYTGGVWLDSFIYRSLI